MLKIIAVIFLTVALVWTISAQTVLAKVTDFLNHSYPGWKQAPGACDSRKWVLTGDFDGDGRRDYLVRVKTGKTAKTMRLNLIAFFGSEDGKYPVKQILDDALTNDMLRSSFSVIKKGTRIQLGEGEGLTVALKHDAASQYICQTDAIKTMVFESGKWSNIYDR